MIEILNVTKKFGDFTAIQNLSIKVEPASIYGLVGYNGAGKTTLLKTVAGVYKPEEGEVRLFGEPVYDNAKVKQRLFYVPDDLYFEPYSTLEKMAKFYQGYYPSFNRNTFQRLVEVFGLDPSKRINGFSKGMQRQGEMILGMSTQPEILLLDESFDGLDPAKRNLMKNMLLEYMAERGCSIMISSHNLHELADTCDRIGLINGKQIVMDCSVDEMSGSRCKFRLVFDRSMMREDFYALELKRFTQDGNIITLSAQGDMEKTKELLMALKPLSLEQFPLTLEEIFLEEMEGTDYDFKEIFG